MAYQVAPTCAKKANGKLLRNFNKNLKCKTLVPASMMQQKRQLVLLLLKFCVYTTFMHQNPAHVYSLQLKCDSVIVLFFFVLSHLRHRLRDPELP